MAVRNVVERFTHPFVIRRRLPADFDRLRFLVSSEAGLRYLVRRSRDLDPSLLEVVRRYVHPGSKVWDVGANVGLFTFAAASRTGPSGGVLAIEPDPWLGDLVRRSAALNGTDGHVRVVATAVSDRAGTARFNVARRSRSTSHLDGFGTTQTGGVRSSFDVRTVTLDGLLDSGVPDVVKIDVEGAEAHVLRGGNRLLEVHRPVIVCEVGEENADEVTSIFAVAGYDLVDGDRFIPTDRATYATVALPRP